MTKRISSILLALLLSASVLASCGKSNEGGKETNAPETNAPETSVTETKAPETNAPETNAPETEAPENNDEASAGKAKDTLNALYTPFLDKLAPAFGAGSGSEIAGYFAGPEVELITETDPDSGETFSYEMPKSGPGAIDLSNPENLFVTLFPADQADKLTSAAVFYNMMNMNNGTFAAFELKDASEVQNVADTMKTAITTNMWMCGFPERYLIVNIDGVVISAFGIGDAVNSLKDAIAENNTSAVVIYDEAL